MRGGSTWAVAGNSSSLYNGHITNQMICSYSNGNSNICHDDEGSPLMCLSSSGVWQLEGVLSSRGGCGGQHQRPNVFTAVETVREWIQKTIGLPYLPPKKKQGAV
jgi:secreted trypsin-like serine protease